MTTKYFAFGESTLQTCDSGHISKTLSYDFTIFSKIFPGLKNSSKQKIKPERQLSASFGTKKR